MTGHSAQPPQARPGDGRELRPTTQIPQSPDWLVRAKDSAAAIQSLVTALALVAAAIWFIRRRLRLPRLKITHEITIIDFTPDQLVLRVVAVVENVGDVVAELYGAVLDVHQIQPLLPDVARAMRLADEAVPWQAGRMRWPILFHRRYDWQRYGFEIEPGEGDTFPFDVRIPASAAVVQVYSHLHNRSKRFKDIGWSTLSVVTIAEHKNSGSSLKSA